MPDRAQRGSDLCLTCLAPPEGLLRPPRLGAPKPHLGLSTGRQGLATLVWSFEARAVAALAEKASSCTARAVFSSSTAVHTLVRRRLKSMGRGRPPANGRAG